eukprot:Plantae.Rhodophyta-Rhodochaete_pulchella.ctg14185.p1 GENE.Plantae.Rhodophyta-Rhodochaete_pulchella.ctg14185~~Plantae.Rhodophyta-Rhodochaete_pulchella.ctg14185.p1  ORF type:complete len:249 (+),score=14.85 Plantae.Rhodophyta-Rhodochaete_pulchella.ctg14185:971-1717(+)
MKCFATGSAFQPSYSIIDADKAERAALKSVFNLDDSHILVCFFRLMVREKERARRLPNTTQDHVIDSVRLLHELTSDVEFSVKSRAILHWLRRKENSPESSFADYFDTQWLQPPTNDWALYHAFPGEPHTNNGVEGFNSMVKSVYTVRKRHSLPAMTSILLPMVRDKSVEVTFAVHRYPDKRTTARAREMPAEYTVDKITPVVRRIHGETSGGVYLISRDGCGCLNFRKRGIASICCTLLKKPGLLPP